MREPDGMSWYLEQAGRIPMLTPAEEISLGHEIQAMMKIKEGEPQDKPLTLKEKRIIKRGKKAKDRMVSANLRLVVFIAKKFASGSNESQMSMLDLIQEGTIGLNRGVEKFDPGRGYKFSTYAYWWIRQGIYRAKGNLDRVIRVPCCGQDVIKKLRRYLDEQKREHDCVPPLEECAEYIGCTVSSLKFYIQHESRPCSLDQMASLYNHRYEKERSLLDLIPCPKPLPEENLETQDGIAQVEYLVEELDDKEKYVIQMRYGLPDGGERAPYKDIAAVMDISRERVRQIEIKALNRLRIKFSRTGKRKPGHRD